MSRPGQEELSLSLSIVLYCIVLHRIILYLYRQGVVVTAGVCILHKLGVSSIEVRVVDDLV